MNQNDIQKFSKHLYERLPEHYRYLDEEQYNKIIKRYLESMNESFVWNNEKIVGLVDLSQISKCPEEYLSVLGHSFGADWIDTISTKYQRKVLSSLIDMYKAKGTYTPIEHLGREISGFEVKIIDDYIPPEYAEEGDEKRRKFTIQLLSPDDNKVPQESQDTIKTVVSHFVPIHTKYVLLVVYFFAEDFINQFEEELEPTTIKQQINEDKDLNIIEGECITQMKMQQVSEERIFNLNYAPDVTPMRDNILIRMDGELILSPHENCDKIIIRKGNEKPKTIYI